MSALLLFYAEIICGQSVIEGKVLLPKPEGSAFHPPRYPGQVGEVAPPDPPSAVVYLEGEIPKASTNNTPHITNEVVQLGMQFRPALMAVQVGTPVSFPNGDDFYHNVFSYSKAKRFDLGRYRKNDRPPVVVFDKPGVVKLYCEIHQHMRGAILVLDTPWFIRTQEDGSFRLQGVPPGQYWIKAWIDDKHVYEKQINVESGQTLRVDFPAQ